MRKKNKQAKKTKSKGTKSTIENENLIIELNTKGGIISAVYLKKYKIQYGFHYPQAIHQLKILMVITLYYHYSLN